MPLILIILVVLLFAGGSGYVGYNHWGYYGGAGISLGTIVIAFVVLWALGVFRPRE